MTTLRQGDRSSAVRELQLLLLMAGYSPGLIDGIFGPRTRAATERHHLETVPDVSAESLTWWGVEPDDIERLRSLPRHAVEVPRILTPCTAVDMRIALAAGYVTTFERDPNPLAIRVALAQFCIEHGCEPWGSMQTEKLEQAGLLPGEHLQPKAGAMSYIAVWGLNCGNRQVTREDREGGERFGKPLVPWFNLRAPEGEGAAVRKLTSACYASPNLAESAARYWRFLRDSCGPALAAFEKGDPALAAHELKHGAWAFSGSEEAYKRAMVDRFRSIP